MRLGHCPSCCCLGLWPLLAAAVVLHGAIEPATAVRANRQSKDWHVTVSYSSASIYGCISAKKIEQPRGAAPHCRASDFVWRPVGNIHVAPTRPTARRSWRCSIGRIGFLTGRSLLRRRGRNKLCAKKAAHPWSSISREHFPERVDGNTSDGLMIVAEIATILDAVFGDPPLPPEPSRAPY